MLFCRREAAVERQHLGRPGLFRIHAAHSIHRVADLGLAGEEDEHIAVRLAIEFAERRKEGVDVVALALLGGAVDGGAVADLDRIGAP